MSASESCLSDDAIAALAAGDSAARGALAHVETCDLCRELVSAACARRTNSATITAGGRLAAGTLLGHYRIERPLGAGGMGIVYLARDLELDRDVAVKFLHASDDRAHARLVRESQALARLNHPNVVTAHEVGRHGDASYLIMEHVDGGTVCDWLRTSPRTSLDIAGIYAQAARGLAAAHAVGLVHRDVKPDNVLVGSDGRARVSDFGLVGVEPASGIAATGHTQGGMLLGTLLYMAPEVLAGGPADPRSDQWSLCASLWESLFDTPPFAGTTRDELAAATRRGHREIPSEVPAWLRRVLSRGLATDAAKRFPSLDVLASALAPARRPVKRTAAAVIGIAALAAAIGATLAARDPAPKCNSDLNDVWADSQRATIEAHFATFGERGRAIARLVEPVLTTYASGWSLQREEVCHVDQVGPVPALRAACLDTRHQALTALVTALAGVDAAGAQNALGAAQELPALDDCAAVERLAGRQPLPDSPVARTQLVALQQQYAAAHARGALGKSREALLEVTKIAAAADTIGYQPLVAEALRFAGRAQRSLVDSQSVATLRHAYWAAIAGADDRQITDTGLDLLSAGIRMGLTTGERDDLREQIRALVARLRWRRDPVAPTEEAYLAAAEGADDFARGLVSVAERELRHAIAVGTAALGTHDARLAPIRRTLAKVLIAQDRPDEAATVAAQSLDFEGNWIKLGGGLDGLSEGGIAVSFLDIADELHGVGRDDQALELVHQMRTVPGHDVMSPMFLLALDDFESEIAVAQGDLATARTFNERAFATLGPAALPIHTAGLRATRAEIMELGGDPQGAEREYRQALAAFGNSSEITQSVYFSFARCLTTLGRADEAEVILERELAKPATNPRDAPPAWLLLAELQWKRGHHAAAIASARAGHELVRKLPALGSLRVSLEHWLAAHPPGVVVSGG